MSDVRIDQAARLAEEWAALGSCEFDVLEENTVLPSWAGSEDEAFRWIETHYIETPTHQRFMDISMKNKAGKVLVHTTSRTDGRRHSILEYQKDEPDSPQTLFIGTSFNNESTHGGSARPEPLKFYFIDKIPLHEALPSSTYLGKTLFHDRQSHIFLFKDVLWSQMRQDLVLHLAEDGIFPHLMIFYKNDEDRLNNSPLWSWSATKLETIQKKAIPVKSRSVEYDRGHPGRETSVVEMSLQKVAFGKSYPVSTFWRDGDAKTTISDAVKGKITPPSIQPTRAQTVVSNPIRVDSVTDNSIYLTMGALTIGAVVLLVDLVIWYRRS